MKTVIMAGGRGTRIASIASNIPKPMIPIEGKPVLESEIENLRDQGFDEIIITVSHLGEKIENYFGDGRGVSPVTHKPFGVNIKYYFEEIPMGNAGALFKLRDQLTDDFLLLNGDVVFDIDFNRFVEYHRKKGGLATLFTHPNSHPYDSGLIIAKEDASVEQWLTKEDARPEYYRNRVNAGLHVLSPGILEQMICSPKIDLDRHLLKPLAGTGKMYAYDSPEYVKDMGTPERYASVCDDARADRIRMKNLSRKQRAVFLDRDGTINRYVGFLRKAEQLELLPGVAQAIRMINASGMLAIVATNQPVIARGEVTFEGLREIHNKMETLLGYEHAFVDDIFVCIHHPHKGYPGERFELKMDCECRKPKPGLLLQAAEKYNIDLSESWMVGDSESDILAGKAAGCKTALISPSQRDFGQTVSFASLLEFAEQMIGYSST